LKVSVERVGSVLVIISPIILIVGLVWPYIVPDFYFHAVTMVIGGFTIFCSGVVFPLFSSIAGGRPRVGFESYMLVIASLSLLSSFSFFFVYGFSMMVVFVFVFLFSTSLFVFIQANRSRVGGILRYSLIYPFFSGMLVSLGFIFGLLSDFDFLLGYSFSFVSSLVMVVGGFFLSNVYGGVNKPLFVGSLILNFIVVFLLLFLEVPISYIFFIHSLSLIVYLISLRFWNGFYSDMSHVRKLFFGHSLQFVSAIIYCVSSFIFGLKSVSVFIPLHSLLAGFVSIGVFSQAILLSPVIIASYRGRMRIEVFPLPQVLLLFSVLSRMWNLYFSFFFYSLAFLVLIFAINPSFWRIWIILRYGTEEGYARLAS